MVSQSGAYLVTFASNYDGIIQPAASISFGNQMDLTVGDFLEHFNGRADIDVIACYVEGFRPGDGDKFVTETRRAHRLGKRVIIYKAGKTALGARAAASHTASLAGDYAVARACLEGAGATVAESLDEFEDLLKTFTLLARRPAARTSSILPARSVAPASANPPGMRMIDSDRSSPTRSVMAARAPSAGIETTARSTFSGRSATDRTQGTPSMSSASWWTT